MKHSDFEKIMREACREARKDLRPRLVDLLQPHTQDPESLIDECYAFHNNVPAMMLHTLMRLVELANQSQDEQLQLFWLIVCAESLMKLRGNAPPGNRKRAIKFFEQYIMPGDRDLLESNFQRSLGDKKVGPRDSVELKLSEIIGVLYSVRSEMVHEGITYNFHFSDGITWMMNWVNIAKPGDSPDIRVFETRIQCELFRAIVLRTGIECLRGYLST